LIKRVLYTTHEVAVKSHALLLLVLLVPFAGLLAGCEGSSPTRSAAEVDTLANGTIEIRNPPTGLWRPEDSWSVVEVWRLGTVSGEGPEVFGDIRDLQLDALGRVWVYDGHAREIRVFDASGRHVRTVGQAGRGPGEFVNVAALRWSPGGRLWAVDQQAGRVSVFDTTGTFVTSHRIGTFYQLFPWPGAIDELGLFYDVTMEPEPGGEVFLVRFDSLLNPVDTLTLPRHPDGPQVFEHVDEHSYTSVSIPFSGEALWAIARDGGFWVAITGRYQLLRLGPSGDTLRVSSKPFEPVPVRREEVDAAIERMDWFRGRIDRSRIPDFKPAIDRSLLDDEGNLWVVPLREGDDRGRLAQVFDSAGFYLGELDLPISLIGLSPAVIRENTMVAVVTDSLDVPYIARLAIHKGSSAR
jgi:hypothetical protein